MENKILRPTLLNSFLIFNGKLKLVEMLVSCSICFPLVMQKSVISIFCLDVVFLYYLQSILRKLQGL